MYSNYFDVVIIPPLNIREYAIQISQQIGGKGKGEFVLGRNRFIPHISLYHIPVKKRQITEFKKTLKKIISESKKGNLNLKNLKAPKEGSLWIEVNRPQWLVNLHQKIVEETLVFSDPEFNAKKVWGSTYNAIQKNLIHEYGSPYVGRYFQPHITLTILKDKESNWKKVVFQPKKFRVSSVSVYQLGPYHSCQKKIFTIRKS